MALAALFIDIALVNTMADAPKIDAVARSINPEAAAKIVVKKIKVDLISFFFWVKYY